MLTMRELPEEELARRIALGGTGAREPEAEAELCRRFAPRVRLYGLRHLRDEDAAQDLAQHALLVVLEAIRAGRLESPAHLAAFLFGACRNLVSSMRRGERRAAIPYDGELVAPPVEHALDRHRLAHCFDGLPRREQEVLRMSFHEERPIDEIAGALQLTAINARVIRHRAIARLRSCMEGG
jgi:RNA polymerase sigma-70 factor, ECF subfamily